MARWATYRHHGGDPVGMVSGKAIYATAEGVRCDMRNSQQMTGAGRTLAMRGTCCWRLLRLSRNTSRPVRERPDR